MNEDAEEKVWDDIIAEIAKLKKELQRLEKAAEIALRHLAKDD